MTYKDLVKGEKVVFTDAKLHEKNPKWYPPVGTVGTVMHDEDDWIQWPKGSTSLDDCWSARPDALAPACSMKGHVSIFTDSKDYRKIIAKNELTGKVGIARCNPEDEFNFATGAQLALERLFKTEKESPAKSKFKVGDVVVGTKKANRYGITREGWVGVVTKILDEPEKGLGCDTDHWVTFYAKPVNHNGISEFDLCDDAFDLLDDFRFVK